MDLPEGSLDREPTFENAGYGRASRWDWRRGNETSNFKIQTSEKIKNSNLKSQAVPVGAEMVRREGEH